MSLKIEKVHPDACGNVRKTGLFDGAPFEFEGRGGRWHLRAGARSVTMEATDTTSRAEAGTSIYALVARIRESAKRMPVTA